MPRRKKDGERYPCGKLKPERFAPAVVRRMFDGARARVVDPLFGTQVGLLCMEGLLTEAHVSAASHFAKFMGYYDRLVGNPSRTARSPDYQMGRAGTGPMVEVFACDNCAGGCVHCEAKIRASADYDRIREKLDNKQWSVVYHTVLLNEVCAWPHKPELTAGLDRLADLFGFTAPPKRAAA